MSKGSAVYIAILSIYVVAAVVCGAAQQVRRADPPIWQTCFRFNLTINEAISPEVAAVLARELQDTIPKIAEACDSIRVPRAP